MTDNPGFSLFSRAKQKQKKSANLVEMNDDDENDDGSPPMPYGWKAFWDENTGRYYYHEKATGVTTWEWPFPYGQPPQKPRRPSLAQNEVPAPTRVKAAASLGVPEAISE